MNVVGKAGKTFILVVKGPQNDFFCVTKVLSWPEDAYVSGQNYVSGLNYCKWPKPMATPLNNNSV